LEEVDHKLAQSNKNVKQGELGRTLAMNKVNEMKISLAQLAKNYEQEAKFSVSDGKMPEDEEDFHA
jgi:hypothetical protein